ncbi:MAG: TetR/AcrR family transcriptional regulator [Kofleriaceae bacterium]
MRSRRRPRPSKPTPPLARRRPRQPRAIVTIDAVLIAVERVLDAHGPSGLTTNRVAEVAGVSIGSVYQYYPNKQALIGAVQERVLDDLFEAIDIVLTSSGDRRLADVAARIAEAMLRVYHARRPIYRWLIELRTEAAYQDRFCAHIDRFIDRVAAFLAARAMAPDPRVTAFVLVSAVEGIANAVAARVGRRSVHVGADSRTAEIDVMAISGGAIAAIIDVLASIEVTDIARH